MIDRYLDRIGFSGPVRRDAETLAALQLATMMTVPFENLDVFAGLRPSTLPDWSVPKVVERRRGGWCFEINGAFGAVLTEMGFDVAYHSARVHSAGAWGPALDHLCLVVNAGGERWLVDAGFGDSAVTPVALDARERQERRPRDVRIVDVLEGWVYQERTGDDAWENQYLIDPVPRPLAAFQGRSDALATGDGGGHFTAKPFATRALDGEGSRVWLLKDRVEFRRGDGHQPRTSIPVGRGEWGDVLWVWFGLEAPVGVLERVAASTL